MGKLHLFRLFTFLLRLEMSVRSQFATVTRVATGSLVHDVHDSVLSSTSSGDSLP